jgi:hypothetical protein
MPDTFVKIATITVGAGGASSIDFVSIPSRYTDLCIKISSRAVNSGTDYMLINFNTLTSNFSAIYLDGSGSTATSSTLARFAGRIVDNAATSNTFSNNEIYIFNYAGSNNKSYSVDAVNENNGTTANSDLIGGLWSNTAAITSIGLTTASGNFAQYSTVTLYGIKKD